MEEQDIEDRREIPGIPNLKSKERTLNWVRSNPNSVTQSLPEKFETKRQPEIPKVKDKDKKLKWAHTKSEPLPPLLPKEEISQQNSPMSELPKIPRTNRALHTSSQSFVASTPIRELETSASHLIETLTLSNKQMVAGLARNNLPKCHPDTFSGDPTLFHPWKMAFKAMISDAEVSAVNEINYLRSFTSGAPQQLVDNFRKRQQHDPSELLKNLWEELERRFGNPATITNTLLERMHKTAAFSDDENIKLQEFADLCADVESQIAYLPGLACLNFPNAIQPIVEKLPSSLRKRWEKEIAMHYEENAGAYPGFVVFSKVVQNQAKIKNNPNVHIGAKLMPILTLATNTLPTNNDLQSPSRGKENTVKRCPFHERAGHSLEECMAFRAKTFDEKTEWISNNRLCYRCFSRDHQAHACQSPVKCSACGDSRHPTLLHKERPQTTARGNETVETRCTAVCSASSGGTSCSKILLVDVFLKNRPDFVRRVYAIIDEQSNSSLISSELAHELGVLGPQEKYYLSTCTSEKEIKYGRRVTNVIVQSPSGTASDLPTLIECDSIPQDKREIPTPEMARRFPHLGEIANEIPPLDSSASIHLLIGRDAPELLKVREFRNGPKGAPWAQRLTLGWTITGQMCLDLAGGPVHARVCRTNVHSVREIPSLEPHSSQSKSERFELVPCPNRFKIMGSLSEKEERLKENIFHTSREDNETSLSCEDRKFLDTMETGIHKNQTGHWEMPLPFRQTEVNMPNNRVQAFNRLNGLLRTLKKKPQMERDYLDFMEKILSKGHASPVPHEEVMSKNQSGKVWYLPHFGVYHPKKPTQIRVVFDSSAEFEGVSLNKELLSGPDMMNSLLGVLIRFRTETTAVMCDIEQMFHSFYVAPCHRDYLRFLWFQDNEIGKPIIEYRMNVHLFGNGPSPAVATFGLRKTAADGEEEFGSTASNFVHRNFYVDDGLASLPTSRQAIDLVTTAQTMLATANLRLHKVVSNSIEVMEAFPAEDRGKDVRDLDLRRDSLPAQRSLGVYWDLEDDVFTFKVSPPDKPFTRRGVLSIVNSIYDPLGLAVPVLLEGRLLLQQLVIMGKKKNNDTPLGWDDPLPETQRLQWQRWQNSLKDLEKVTVPRCYHPNDFGRIARAEIHAFSDASKDAIGASVYLRLISHKGEISTAFLFGQSRVAPAQSTSIPRLELCAAALAVQAGAKVVKEIDLKIDEVTYYTDSRVVLGYLQNDSRRFYVYVANRVQLIRRLSSPSQWRYVDTTQNPADLATRRLTASSLIDSDWLKGPCFLRSSNMLPSEQEEIPLDVNDPEVRKEISTCATRTRKHQGLGTERFTRFSSLASLQRAIAYLIAVAKGFRCRKEQRRLRSSAMEGRLRNPTVKELEQAMTLIIQAVQEEAFGEVLELGHHIHFGGEESTRDRLREKKCVTKTSVLFRLDPFIGDDGLLRVGGRLRRASLEYGEKHPVLLPKGHHISKLIVRHYHCQVHHQGRQITHGAIRQAGYWLVNGHHTVSKELSDCIICKKLRGPPLEQRMADLPTDRIEATPPFTNVGFDVFGPWSIQTRRTRGRTSSLKRWGLVFTCLSSRAIHIETLESMDTSSFICALRRFFALRGPALLLRCDRGTNFVGGKSELDSAMREMDQRKLEKYVRDQGCEWRFNPPHASHFGGVWERQIGTIRRVLNAMFLELGGSQLTHELLVTLMAEVTAIVNARPITTVPSDTEEPQPLSPAMLLTMKTRPLGPPPGEFVAADLYSRRRWRCAQYLAGQFWVRWRREYLQTLQKRSKWNSPRRNLTTGDIVLVKDEDAHRNDWPLGRITDAIKSEDGEVRKAQVELLKEGIKKTYMRPIKELVLLVPFQSSEAQPTLGESGSCP
ncbi:uncharacterized protein LOC144663213 [Oculina patagonica]